MLPARGAAATPWAESLLRLPGGAGIGLSHATGTSSAMLEMDISTRWPAELRVSVLIAQASVSCSNETCT
jgi:hypothetical protein